MRLDIPDVKRGQEKSSTTIVALISVAYVLLIIVLMWLMTLSATGNARVSSVLRPILGALFWAAIPLGVTAIAVLILSERRRTL